MDIRPGQPRDLDARLAIDDSFSTERVLLITSSGTPPELDLQLRWTTVKPPGARRWLGCDRPSFAADIERAEGWWVAESAGAVVASLVLSRLDWHPTTGFINDVAVDVAHRGRGIATRMLDAMKQHARAAGLRGVFWEAQTDNHDAIAFALARGFTFAGFNDRWYDNDGAARQREPSFRGLGVFLFWSAGHA